MTAGNLPTRYAPPLADPSDDGTPIRWPRRGFARTAWAYGHARSAFRGRRLAVIDSHFPWRLSGFRYFEALELHRVRPDTVFFSRYQMTDPFPAPVHELRDFPRLAPRLGVTDVFAVFQDFIAGLLGVRGAPGDEWPGFQPGIDISRAISQGRLRVHLGLYPGGGLNATERSLGLAVELARRADTVFTWVPELRERISNAPAMTVAYTNTELYFRSAERWRHTTPLRCVFAADDRPRKGLQTVLRAFEELEDDRVHLDIVGPHAGHLVGRMRPGWIAHGWIDPVELSALYRDCHVVVSPIEREDPLSPEGDGGIPDGFPTNTVTDAMATGALAISSNPPRDYDRLTAETHYIEIDERDPAGLAAAIRRVQADPVAARRIADAGSDRVHDIMSLRSGVVARLAAMGLAP